MGIIQEESLLAHEAEGLERLSNSASRSAF